MQIPLDYSVEGSNAQTIRIRLKPGQEIFAEAGKMIYKQSQIVWETRMSGDTIGEMLLGEPLFLTHFHAATPGIIGFAGASQGKVQALELKPRQSVFVQSDSFLAAESSTQLNIASVKKTGFILEKLTGPGTIFIHAGGDSIEFTLAAGETLQVDPVSIVAFDEGVAYDIQTAASIKTAIFGGEELWVATLTGPGRVILQSMTLEKMRR